MSTKKPDTTSQPASTQAAGSLDPTFGINGVVTLKAPDITQTSLYIQGITSNLTSEADQRIYACAGGASKVFIIRLLQDGEIDTTFGNAGYLTLPTGDPASNYGLTIHRYIFLGSGKIIGWGEIITVPFEKFMVPAAVCFTVDGILDTSFGDQGLAIFKPFVPKTPSESNFNPSAGRSIRARLLNLIEAEDGGTAGSTTAIRQADGKLLLLGSTNHVSTYYHIASYLMRINIDGSLDTGFGQEGVLLIEDPENSTLPHCQHFDIDRRGGIVVTGTHYGLRSPVLIARYDAQGDVDRSFGKNGVVHINSPYDNACHARGVMALDDGKIVMIAAFFLAEVISQHAAVIKLLPNGDRDPTFNNGEPALIDLAPEGYLVTSNTTMDDGNRIVVGGGIFPGSEPGFISRVLPNGELDTGFGVNGTAVLEQFYPVTRTAIQNRVNILAVANDRNAEPQQSCLIRVVG